MSDDADLTADPGEVSTWRDTVSPAAQVDLDALLNTVLPQAHQLLATHGGFFPFSAVLSTSGDVIVTPSPPARRRPPRGTQVLDSLYAAAREQADTLRATAFVADVRAGTRDAVAVQLEHREGITIGVLLAYRRNWITRKITVGQLLATAGTPRIFGPPAPPDTASADPVSEG